MMELLLTLVYMDLLHSFDLRAPDDVMMSNRPNACYQTVMHCSAYRGISIECDV